MGRNNGGSANSLGMDSEGGALGLLPDIQSRTIELPAELWEWVEADADRHGRSLGEELSWIIREHFAARRQHIPLAEHWSAAHR